jgi:CubicO group peptidase (beta-lactamase class C family)
MRYVALLCLAACAGTPALAGAQTPTAAAIDALYAPYDRDGSPGCLMGVVRDGEVVYARGYGFANLDYGIRHSPEMVYYVGSVSKQFTAAAIALLAQDGRISLDDDVRRYLPELPDYGRTMTIRHLVHHTSGVRDIYTLMSLAGIRMEDVLTNADALALIARQKELNFLPGDDYLYSNSGYWLLGQIIERVTGQTLAQYAEAKIFRPLGMTNTRFYDDAGRILRNRVISYGGDGNGGYRITYLGNFDKVGAGGLYTTLADLVKWDANFYEPKLGGHSFLRTMHTRGVLTSGDTLPYAFGINVQERRGLGMVRHGGSLMGFRADLVRYPSERFTVISLCNLGSIDPGPLADRVADLYLGSRLRAVADNPAGPRRAAAPAAAGASAPPLSAEQLRAFAGRYYSPELDATYTLTAAADTLRLTRRTGTQNMRASAPDRFTAGSQVFVFVRDSAGRVNGFTVQAGRVRNIHFARQQ